MVLRWTSRSLTRSSFVPTTTIGMPFGSDKSISSDQFGEHRNTHGISAFDTVDLFSEIVDFPEACFLG
jgi:hypothetical protein